MTRNSIAKQKVGWMTVYADSIANHLMQRTRFADLAWDDVRDYCDQETQGDLDCFRLDMLADMVVQRLSARAA